jgi:hypothetical protein
MAEIGHRRICLVSLIMWRTWGWGCHESCPDVDPPSCPSELQTTSRRASL